MSRRISFAAAAAIFCVCLLGAGCRQGADPGAPKLHLTVAPAERCSGTSPEIRVGNIPAGTADFRVSLRDNDAPSFNHGGGTYKNDGTGVIPEGALKNYKGPCPPTTHSYEFTVVARDAGGKTLSSGVYSFNQ